MKCKPNASVVLIVQAKVKRRWKLSHLNDKTFNYFPNVNYINSIITRGLFEKSLYSKEIEIF